MLDILTFSDVILAQKYTFPSTFTYQRASSFALEIYCDTSLLDYVSRVLTTEYPTHTVRLLPKPCGKPPFVLKSWVLGKGSSFEQLNSVHFYYTPDFLITQMSSLPHAGELVVPEIGWLYPGPCSDAQPFTEYPHYGPVNEEERDPVYYDDILARHPRTDLHHRVNGIAVDLFRKHCSPQYGDRVVSCGTGDGILFNYITPREYRTGFDFSTFAVDKCHTKFPEFSVIQDNIYTTPIISKCDLKRDVLFFIEVLEHVHAHTVLARIPSGTRVVVSVPSFKDPSHVQTYKNRRDLQSLLYIELDEIKQLNHPTQNSVIWWICYGRIK